MTTWVILTAVLLDFILGDPIYSLHPVRLIGNFALRFESLARKTIKSEIIAGLSTAILTLLISVFLTYIITATLLKISYIAGFIVSTYFIYSSIACKDMIKHSKEIFNQLRANNLILARAKTSMIVGRDTKHMHSQEVIRATIESIAENTVDGVLAPLFYAFIGALLFGITGAACFAILYRAINTLDSSFGYKNEKYISFGMISAKIDDIFNFLPARLSIFIITIAAFFTGLNWKKSFTISLRDHSNHASPNSGYSEAAYAGALELQFGGETLYNDEIINRPILGDNGRTFEINDIVKASKLLFNTTLLATLAITLILFF